MWSWAIPAAFSTGPAPTPAGRCSWYRLPRLKPPIKLQEKLRVLAAGILEANAADLEVDLEAGQLAVRGDSSRVGDVLSNWRAPLRRAGAAPAPKAWRQDCRLPATLRLPAKPGPAPLTSLLLKWTSILAAVTVKRYFVCHDAGRIVNPMLADGQIVGGVATGLGGALMEEVLFDDDGQPLSASLMDYLIPTAMDMPNVGLSHIESAESAPSARYQGLGRGRDGGCPGGYRQRHRRCAGAVRS